jgi:DNA-binding transcriptional ArsR family regulator
LPTLVPGVNVGDIGNSVRLELVRLLIASPNSLTELALGIKKSASWIYHHIQILESAKLVERYEVERPGKWNKKFYRARSDAFLLRDVILPKANIATAVISGSQDPALEQVAETLSEDVNLLYLPGNSLDGMANLRSG